ncbi:hypothetical protein PMZ80_004350 [Knufia obscura]|uniref:Uncharacterized protein n=2 Tax=Knufia TaxID=430999 RepID=A0AAN8EY39_9EURO|nr:hypothetical protein PMZ80_004350 [Knufia obscura]KAK5948146.1 hypothetical protein OHC33_010799 [Knufia fluminis]
MSGKPGDAAPKYDGEPQQPTKSVTDGVERSREPEKGEVQSAAMEKSLSGYDGLQLMSVEQVLAWSGRHIA